MKKNTISLIVLVIVFAMLFIVISCNTAETTETTTAAETTETTTAAETTKVVLRFTDFQSGIDGITNSYKELIKIFEEENPGVTIDYQQYSIMTYNEFLKPAIASGAAPDLFAINPGDDLVEVAKAGAYRNLTNDIDDEWKSWLGPAYNFRGIWYDDAILILPQDTFTNCIWYYKDMLKEIGWEPLDSTDAFSTEDYIAMVEPAKAKGYDVMIAGLVEPWCVWWPYFNFIHQQQQDDSIDMIDQALNGEISWQQDIFRNGFDIYKKLHDAGVWRKDSLNMDYQVQAFEKWANREGIFMWSQGDWFVGGIKEEDNNPDNLNIGIIQYPLVNENSTVAFNKNFGTDIGVYAKGKNQDLAIKWIRLTNSPKGAEIFIKNGVNPASGADPNNLPEINNQLFKECIKLYNSPGRFSELYYYNPTSPAAIKALSDGIANVLLDVDTADNVLQKLDEICGYKE